MGGSTYSDEQYTARATLRAKTGAPVFAHHAAVAAGTVEAKVHESLDPAKFKNGRREARDSAEHPNSNAIAICFDQTGSMQDVPKIIQAKLPALMGLLGRKGYIVDPAIMIAAHGDAHNHERAPIQMGQFESGIEIENDLTNLFLEGNGGGNGHETPEYFLYGLARHTSIDCFEKRGKRGYAFIITDEKAGTTILASVLREHFGPTVPEPSDVDLPTIVKEVKEKYHLFVIMPNMSSHWMEKGVMDFWKEVVGPQNFLLLEDPNNIAEFIGATIGLMEESVDMEKLGEDLINTGTSKAAASAISTALSKIGSGTIAAPKGTGLATL